MTALQLAAWRAPWIDNAERFPSGESPKQFWYVALSLNK